MFENRMKNLSYCNKQLPFTYLVNKYLNNDSERPRITNKMSYNPSSCLINSLRANYYTTQFKRNKNTIINDKNLFTIHIP